MHSQDKMKTDTEKVENGTLQKDCGFYIALTSLFAFRKEMQTKNREPYLIEVNPRVYINSIAIKNPNKCSVGKT